MYRHAQPGYPFRAFRGRQRSCHAKGFRLLSTVVLWAHAICGAVWIGASACFAVAGLALTAGSAEQRDFLEHGASRVNRLAMAAAIALPITGGFNWSQAVKMHRGILSPTFSGILAAKIALYFLMLWALGIATRALPKALDGGNALAPNRAMATMVKAHAAIVAMGAVAMMLGVWLTGA
jgi:hypothetical protein